MSSFVPRSIRNLFTVSRAEDELSKEKGKKRRRDSDIYEFPGSDDNREERRGEKGMSPLKEKSNAKAKGGTSVKSSPVMKRARREDESENVTPNGVNGKQKRGTRPGPFSSPVKSSKLHQQNSESEVASMDVLQSSRARKPAIRVRKDETEEVDDESEDEDIRRSARSRKPSAKIREELDQTPKSLEKKIKSASGKKEEVHAAVPIVKRGPGRPKKVAISDSSGNEEHISITPSKRRGRPPKTETPSKSKSATKLGKLSSNRGKSETINHNQTPSKKKLKHMKGTPKSSKSVRHNELEDHIAMEIDTPSKSSKFLKKVTGDFQRDELEKADSTTHDGLFQSQPVIISKPKKLLKPVKWVSEHPSVYRTMIQITMEKLSQRRRAPIAHLNEEHSKIRNLVEATVTAGEGNSMLIIGARGSGKTLLVNHVLSELEKTQKKDFLIVRLNGFIQTDDKLALREIWRQLGREMEIDEEGGKSYSDTLTMLLATLSHPDEIAGERVGEVATSVVFVMEEFDLFATHARQTLLYNLLDIAQSRKAPIAVLGLTTKFDVTESLEKRVKSRFSHRYVYLPLAKNLAAFQEMCMASVLITQEELTFEEKSIVLTSKHGSKQPDFLSDWNEAVKNLFTDDEFINAYILPTYYLTKSIPTVLTSLLLTTASLLESPPETALLPIEQFLENDNPSLAPPPSTLSLILPSLSELQLSLLIAAARLDIIHDSDTCSFGMAYAEYVDLSSKARLNHTTAGALATGAGTRVWGREVARGEWETLVKVGLLVPVSESGGVAAVTLGGLVRVDVKLEEIPGSLPGLSGTMERWCRQI